MMMEFIADWITQIIIFILLATIIDLLIPNLTMNKYIKLVIGLILILILLTPIFALFKLDVEGLLKQSYTALFEQDTVMEEVKDSIELQKTEIEQLHGAYILEEMAVQLKSLANEDLMQQHQAKITEIYFAFHDEEPISYESLEEVIVYLEPAADKEGEIQTVEEVVINGRPKQLEENDEAIIQQLREQWELTEKKITVYWEGGTS